MGDLQIVEEKQSTQDAQILARQLGNNGTQGLI